MPVHLPFSAYDELTAPLCTWQGPTPTSASTRGRRPPVHLRQDPLP